MEHCSRLPFSLSPQFLRFLYHKCTPFSPQCIIIYTAQSWIKLSGVLNTGVSVYIVLYCQSEHYRGHGWYKSRIAMLHMTSGILFVLCHKATPVITAVTVLQFRMCETSFSPKHLSPFNICALTVLSGHY